MSDSEPKPINPGLVNPKEITELEGLSVLADQILTEKPDYVVVSDAHVNSEPQKVASALLQALAQSPQYVSDDVGFYVEALYDSAKPAEGDLSGAVIKYDDPAWSGNTNYRGAIDTALGLRVQVHGIDLNKPGIDQEGKERMLRWKQAIEAGSERIKVLLVGAGHVWNDPRKDSDLMHKLDKPKWLIQNEKAYIPPGFTQNVQVNVGRPDITQKNIM